MVRDFSKETAPSTKINKASNKNMTAPLFHPCGANGVYVSVMLVKRPIPAHRNPKAAEIRAMVVRLRPVSIGHLH